MLRRGLAGAVIVVASLAFAQPAAAVHLFPLTPVFDPLGHDCAQNLGEAPGDSAATVLVAGFSFIDKSNLSSTTTIAAGESVTWKWLLDHCHSVTFSPDSPDPEVVGTQGAEGFEPPQPELVRKSEDGSEFTATFDEAGTYSYLCVHHEGVGMQGEVVVTPD